MSQPCLWARSNTSGKTYFLSKQSEISRCG
jgi:hypothetical protein